MRTLVSAEERFFAKVAVAESGCWLWQGAKRDGGYGEFYSEGRIHTAHRFIYTLLGGSIPDTFELDHLCRDPACVNPDHLEPVSHRTNVMRGRGLTARNAMATHCIHGHEFTADNTWRESNGRRHCRTCQRERMARIRARRKAEA